MQITIYVSQKINEDLTAEATLVVLLINYDDRFSKRPLARIVQFDLLARSLVEDSAK